MSGAQELAVREKQELAAKEEKTTPGRYYVPAADVFETAEALTVILEMPGVQKSNVSIALENDVLRVDGQIELANYKEMDPPAAASKQVRPCAPGPSICLPSSPPCLLHGSFIPRPASRSHAR
jgi:hypothetical protein